MSYHVKLGTKEINLFVLNLGQWSQFFSKFAVRILVRYVQSVDLGSQGHMRLSFSTLFNVSSSQCVSVSLVVPKASLKLPARAPSIEA
uniref:Uncharacterized protein n=1 Tax=Tetraselmis sp. GSL018 TaxID=582737 RepID=A0A061RXG6_9CHLO